MATGYYLLDHRSAIPQCGKTRRNGAKATGTIILHDAEGGTDLSGADMGAENVANYILGRSTYGSYHDLVDRDTHIPMAPIDYETWHSVPDNPWSVGISVAWNKADLARMTPAQRRSYYVPLARVVLLRRAEFAERGITVPIGRMLTAAETQARKPGISTHSRTDPSRRSDPFGTGSVYEAEFLAVLAELAKTTTVTQEDDMTPEEHNALTQTRADVAAIKTAVLAIKAEVLAMVADVSAPEEGITQRRAQERDLAVSRRSETRVIALDAKVDALIENAGADAATITQAVTASVDKALSNLEITLSTED
jgi:hypothetical protein